MNSFLSSAIRRVSIMSVFTPMLSVSARKAFFFLFISGLLPSLAMAQIHVPDVSFRDVLSSNYGITFDGGNNISNPDSAANLLVMEIQGRGISDMSGIEAFTGLTQLMCDQNSFDSLDVSANTNLTYLTCGANGLTSLKLPSGTALDFLFCGENLLTSLEVSANTALTNLQCFDNQLTSLDVSTNTALLTLYCNNNQITNLDISANTDLTFLNCSDNGLTNLDVSANTALTTLDCINNRIPIILTDGSVTSITKDDISQVAALRDSTENPAITSNETGGYVLGSSGAIVNITTNTGSNSAITSGTGTNPGTVGNLPGEKLKIFPEKYWTINNPNLTGTYNLILDLSPITEITDFASISVLKRSDPSSAWQDASAIDGTTVQYLEPFVMINDLTSFSDFAIAGIDTTPPAAPQNLMATEDQTQITLSWNRNSETDFKHYQIFQSTSPNAVVLIDSTTGGISDTTKIITGLNAGTTYYFRVTAVDSADNISDFSNEISAGLPAIQVPDANFRSVLSSNYGITFDDSSNITNPDTIVSILSLDIGRQNISDLTGIEAFTSLTTLLLYENQVTSLDVTALTALHELDCAFNQLDSLDVSQNNALTTLSCQGNTLTSLDVSANTLLSILVCYENQLTSLDVTSNLALSLLHCNDNPIGNLDLSNNTALSQLFCTGNQLSSLDVSAATSLTDLVCWNNRIPIILTAGPVANITKDDISQVATFRDSTANPVLAANETGAYVLSTSGAIVNITDNTGPGSAITSATGTNPSIAGELPAGTYNIANDIYWTISNPDLTGRYNLILDLTSVPVTVNFDSIKVLKRDNAATLWQDVAAIEGTTVQYLEPFILVNGLTSFSDFALGNTYSAPFKFDLLMPVNNDTIINFSTPIEFTWQTTIDPDGDPVSYSLRITGGTALDTTINSIADSTFIFAGSEVFEYLSDYRWWVLATDGQYTTSSADTFRFHTPANSAPLPFALLMPVNEDSLADLSTPFEFAWQSSFDINGDPVSYSLRITGGTALDTTINSIADSTFIFAGSEVFEYLSDYRWWVLATDGQYTTSSADTFRFHTPANNAPLRFDLLMPVDNDTLPDLSAAVEFLWQSAVDKEGDAVTYSLRIFGGTGLDTTISALSDTVLIFNGGELFEYASAYQWYVIAMSGENTTTSADTLTFYTPADISYVDDLSGIPKKFSLAQNYPNPFNPSTTIEFSLAKDEYTTLKIYNILGAEVATLVSDELQAGQHRYNFDGGRLASGVYYYEIRAGEFRDVKKLILLR